MLAKKDIRKEFEEKNHEKTNLFLECKDCQTLWNIIGTTPKLKGRLLINPFTSQCYICEKGSELPPALLNLWEFCEPENKWKKVETR